MLGKRSIYIAATRQLLGFSQHLLHAPTYLPSSKVSQRDRLKNTRLFLSEEISTDRSREKVNGTVLKRHWRCFHSSFAEHTSCFAGVTTYSMADRVVEEWCTYWFTFDRVHSLFNVNPASIHSQMHEDLQLFSRCIIYQKLDLDFLSSWKLGRRARCFWLLLLIKFGKE